MVEEVLKRRGLGEENESRVYELLYKGQKACGVMGICSVLQVSGRGMRWERRILGF